jgi:hypothetical protein
MEAILAEVGLLLGTEIPQDPGKCWDLLWQTDKVRFRLAMASADASVAYSERLQQVLLPKGSEYTELDRTTTQRAGSAVQSAMTERMARMTELVDSRVKLLQDYVAFLAIADNMETNNGNDTNGREEDVKAE